MLNTEFYDILDAELTQLVEENGFHPVMKHKGIEKNKPFALLLWFLRIYGRRTFGYSKHITEGKGDSSCDIILDVQDAKKRKVYYVVQAKWNSKKNSTKQIDAKEFKATLDDFRAVFLKKKQETDNENFNEKYEELKQHLAQNGKVKFVYLALCNYNPELADNVSAFESECSDLQILDINRIKRDHINYHYKQLISDNPLDAYSPDEEIELKIERLDISGNFIELKRPFTSYIFLVRPKVIFELYETYKNKIFFKNVRNPLFDSTVNNNIQSTLKSEIPFFWYYNNGITAVTNGIINGGVNNPVTDIIKLRGFQVINGVQTVHSIYQSYRDASYGEQDSMNQEALLTVRLIVINSDELSLKITRFTNSQNPLEERDFWANDETQIRLQDESFDTLYWYEKRRGEFKNVPEGTTVVSSSDLVLSHVVFNLEDPPGAQRVLASDVNYFFVSNKNDKKGLYEEIFNPKQPIQFKDMLAAYLFGETVYPYLYPNEELSKNELIHELLLVRIVLEKYLKRKFDTHELNLNEYILKNHENEKLLFAKIAKFTTELISRMLGNDIITKFDFTKNSSKFWDVKTLFDSLDINKELAEKIENTELDS